MHGYEPDAGTLLRPSAYAAKMERIACRDDGDPMLPSPRDADIHCLLANHLPVASIAVHDDQGAAVHSDLGSSVGVQGTAVHTLYVARQHTYPVAVMPH